ncbi:ketopantoate reductase family protein [Oscillibacter sp. ER4]|uniref:ketopantoate reductase family protein n=1 Tax=Oscillibacter sp. ER4 TaxID=1519439 RepID=UPI000AB74DFA|nr:2-dehydropantoate 2-reductase N-terminal domain-containing protein [Oscillibacter sp. ER4]
MPIFYHTCLYSASFLCGIALVFGAGVLGCNLARNFFCAGKDVTLLARGAWGESIQKNGLRIKDKFSPRMSVSRIPVVTELKAEDKYDVIFVVLRYGTSDLMRTTAKTPNVG